MLIMFFLILDLRLWELIFIFGNIKRKLIFAPPEEVLRAAFRRRRGGWSGRRPRGQSLETDRNGNLGSMTQNIIKPGPILSLVYSIENLEILEILLDLTLLSSGSQTTSTKHVLSRNKRYRWPNSWYILLRHPLGFRFNLAHLVLGIARGSRNFGHTPSAKARDSQFLWSVQKETLPFGRKKCHQSV